MTDVLWATLDAALVHALDLEAEERDAYVASLDPATRNALVPLLRDALADDPLLDHPDVAFAGISEPVPTGKALDGTRVGPYRIEALVGEGGMGRVYRARRADGAYDQTVAVKVVRQSLALAGSDVSARLRRERELLAALDHGGIARLVDGGETEDGVPYLVTEFVDGTPITDYADAKGLGVDARVRLLVDVARAVDHAHRRFVVHRDLKPSNVLVAERDGVARPVVLDFGIAKLLDVADASASASVITRTGMRLLTPAYAAPELYDAAATVSTAADVYGLGALLYELLTGRRPHEGTTSTGPPTTEPTRPSSAVTTLTDGSPARPSVSARSRVLRGDLDTICLKALQPDPARRYASASALADDLERHLTGRPVEARPDSAAYVARRFVHRNRGVVTAASLALLALVVGLGASLASLRSERLARADAETSSRRATEAAELLAGIFANANPDVAEGHAVTVAEAVTQGVARVRTVESDSLRAYMLRVLGETYIKLGEPARADSLLQEALSIHGEAAAGAEASRVRLGLLATRDALADPERVLVLGRRLYADHGRDTDPQMALSALGFMSRAESARGAYGRAVALATQERARAMRDGTAGQRVQASGRLGEALASAGRSEEALVSLEEAVRLSEAAFGRGDRRTFRAMADYGDALGQAGDIDRAEPLIRAVIAFHAERYGANRIGYSLASLGRAMLRTGRFGEAAALLDSAATMGAPIIGRDHEDIGAWRTSEAEALVGARDFDAAEGAAREALRIADAQNPPVRAAARAAARQQLDAARAVRQRSARLESVSR